MHCVDEALTFDTHCLCSIPLDQYVCLLRIITSRSASSARSSNNVGNLPGRYFTRRTLVYIRFSALEVRREHRTSLSLQRL